MTNRHRFGTVSLLITLLTRNVRTAFMRHSSAGDRGYLPIIVISTTSEYTVEIRGLLYSVALNSDAAEQDRREALLELFASAITQWLAQATGDPDYTVVWERPLPI